MPLKFESKENIQPSKTIIQQGWKNKQKMNATLKLTPLLEEVNETEIGMSFRLLRTTFSGSTLHVFFEMVDRKFSTEEDHDAYVGMAMLLVIVAFLCTMIYRTRQWLLQKTMTATMVHQSLPVEPSHECISNQLDNIIADIKHERIGVVERQPKVTNLFYFSSSFSVAFDSHFFLIYDLFLNTSRSQYR